MPLSQQLKSEMTGTPTDASQRKESEKPVIEPVNMPDFSTPKGTELPVSEADIAPPSETPTPATDQMTLLATVYKGNLIKNLIMDCQSYTKYRPNETTGGIFVSWRRKEELPTGLD